MNESLSWSRTSGVMYTYAMMKTNMATALRVILSAVANLVCILVQGFDVKADRMKAVVTAEHRRLGVSSSSCCRSRRHRG